MKQLALFTLLVALSGFSCGSTIHNLFEKKTPHEAYAEVLDDNGLEKTPEGRAWLAASTKALEAPQVISLPYRQQGFFPTGKARALGLQFQAKFGERITFTLSNKGNTPFVLYADDSAGRKQ